MNIKWRIRKERLAIPLMLQGYSRSTIGIWFDDIQEDMRLNGKAFSPGQLERWHKRGYLSSSVRRWGWTDGQVTEAISDFDYLSLFPLNNSFEKWLGDRLTTQRVLHSSDSHFPKVHFSIIQRDEAKLILRVGKEDRPYTCGDVLELIRERGRVELRPSSWKSGSDSYILSMNTGAKRSYVCCNGKEMDAESIQKLIDNLDCSYLITDPLPPRFDFDGQVDDHDLTLWMANDAGDAPRILAAEICILPENSCVPINLDDGHFDYRGKRFSIPGWQGLKDTLCNDAAKIPQISFYSETVMLRREGGFTYVSFSSWPSLPRTRYGDELADYLKKQLGTRIIKRTPSQQLRAYWEKIHTIEQLKVSRKGMRPYMYGLWRSAVWSDLLHTKGVSLPKKLWAHRYGFFSWRIQQYGLTKENYQKFLSDYDYYWLNRINNEYQIWINDKTTFRHVMEPFKAFIPEYYFSVFARGKEKVISKMWDCPADVPEGLDGLLEMLRRKGKLAFKPSGGTHGDGFYCLSCEDGVFHANGTPCGEDGIRKLIEETHGFYVATEYLEMHRELKNIYAKSVNTVRVMVVNEHGYDPRILQTYMRIGSSKTGYTDNVGYGGICVFVDVETGELYQPERIVNHKFIPCPTHPDTGTPISGIVPNWEYTKESILQICRYFCELEYLGFDVAITDDGFQILEINIHQDLHKAATFSDEINGYFRRKIASKRKMILEASNNQ